MILATASSRSSAATAGEREVVGCPDCGTAQCLPAQGPTRIARCVRCAGTLERTHGRSLSAALALSAATVVLLVPANLMMFLRTDVLAVSRSSRLISAAGVMLDDGWPWLEQFRPT